MNNTTQNTLSNTFALRGRVKLEVLDQNGNVKYTSQFNNRVVDTGLQMLASLLAGDGDESPIGRPTHCAVGSDSTDVTSEDTALAHEIARVPFDSITRTNNNVEFVATFGPSQPDVDRCRIAEVGLFNADTGGTMLSRAVFADVNKYKLDIVRISWTITFNYVPSEYDSVWDDDTP